MKLMSLMEFAVFLLLWDHEGDCFDADCSADGDDEVSLLACPFCCPCGVSSGHPGDSPSVLIVCNLLNLLELDLPKTENIILVCMRSKLDKTLNTYVIYYLLFTKQYP